MRTKRLGDMLLEMGLITQEQLKQALEFQSREKGRLGSILIEHNFITERQLIDALRMQLGIEYIDLTKVDIVPEMSRYVPWQIRSTLWRWRRHSALPGSGLCR